MKHMKILFIGDLVGRPGRYILSERLRKYKEENEIDFCVVNAENMANGSGVTENTFKKLLHYGADVVTSGDHIYRNKDVLNFIRDEPRLLRPANLPTEALGNAFGVYDVDDCRIGVLNLQGRIFMNPIDCPFKAADKCLERIKQQTDIILVDFHAEATSEKVAMGRFLDGRVSAVLGTHTHIQTADEGILPKGTAYITDVGMTGPYDSVLGREVKPVLQKLITGMPARFDVAKDGLQMCGALVEIDEKNARAVSIQRVIEHVASQA